MSVFSYTLEKELERRSELLREGRLSEGEAIVALMYGPLVRCIGAAGQEQRRYASDPVIFELACFVHTQVDSYIFLHFPAQHPTMSVYLRQQFQKLFSGALGGMDITPIANARVQTYAGLLRRRAPIDHVLTVVAVAMHDTVAKGGIPREDPTARLAPASIFEHHMVQMALIGWYSEMLPVVMDAIDGSMKVIAGNSSAERAPGLPGWLATVVILAGVAGLGIFLAVMAHLYR